MCFQDVDRNEDSDKLDEELLDLQNPETVKMDRLMQWREMYLLYKVILLLNYFSKPRGKAMPDVKRFKPFQRRASARKKHHQMTVV